MLLTLKAKGAIIASLVVGISLTCSSIVAAKEGPCLGISDYDPEPYYELTINPFPRNQLPSEYSLGGYLDKGTVRTWNGNSNVNLRQQPTTNNSTVLKTIPDQSLIPLYGGFYSEDNYWWWLTEYQGNRGWIRADFVCGDPQ